MSQGSTLILGAQLDGSEGIPKLMSISLVSGHLKSLEAQAVLGCGSFGRKMR